MDSIQEEVRVVEERKKEMGEQSTAQPSATLYVGDLDAVLTDEDLVHAFERFGPVASARVCRDSATGSSLCYAYLNFLSHSHAERALKEMNHVRLNGKPIRLMWSYRDPLTLKSGDGNLFVKNLDGSVGGAELEELFTAYGKVLSCKVATDEEGRSKGFGFVQMDSEEAAQSAIEALHGKICCSGSKKLYVAKFVKKCERQTPTEESKCPNLYIKNLDTDITEDLLCVKFSEFGEVSSAVVMKDELGQSRGFGFVSFKSSEHAMKAKEAMNGSQLGSKRIYVGQAQKKVERMEMLKQQFAEKPGQSLKKTLGFNVYVRNLNDSIDDEKLQDLFSGCGKIVSAKVIHDTDGHSKGFGFVCFSSSEDANKAVVTYNGTMFHGKHLYVKNAQSKESRINSLKHQLPETSAAQHPISDGLCSPHFQQQYEMHPSSWKPDMQFLSLYMSPYQQRPLAPANASYAKKVPFVSELHHPVHTVDPFLGMNCFQPTENGYYKDCLGYFGVPRSNNTAIGVKKRYFSQFKVPKLFSFEEGVKETYYCEGPSNHHQKAPYMALAKVDPERQKQMVDHQLNPLAQKLETKCAPRIRNMLLESNATELHNMLSSCNMLGERINEAIQASERIKGNRDADKIMD